MGVNSHTACLLFPFCMCSSVLWLTDVLFLFIALSCSSQIKTFSFLLYLTGNMHWPLQLIWYFLIAKAVSPWSPCAFHRAPSPPKCVDKVLKEALSDKTTNNYITWRPSPLLWWFRLSVCISKWARASCVAESFWVVCCVNLKCDQHTTL